MFLGVLKGAVLTRALKKLEESGQISYEFKKGQKNYQSFEEEMDVADVKTLHNGESAHSLIITKLK